MCTAPETCGGGDTAHTCGDTFPRGVDGPMPSGTITLNPGDVRDYSTCNLAGTIQVAGGSGWVAIGCANGMAFSGTITARNGTEVGTFATTPTQNIFLGRELTYSIAMAAGGPGGTGPGTAYCATGQPGGLSPDGTGNGGGGAACTYSGNGGCEPGASYVHAGDATDMAGGTGGAMGGATPGPGASTFAGDGSGAAGSPGQQSNNGTNQHGAGGGGGFHGKHGQGVFLKVKGDVTGSGVVDVSGSRGGKGGTGANSGTVAPGTYSIAGGSGGGGGAGGSAGTIVLHVTGALDPRIQLKAVGGMGGAGGPGGASGNSNVGTTGTAGGAGFNGSVACEAASGCP